MLNYFIIGTLVCLVLTFIANGFSLYTFLLLIPTGMFALRKLAIHLKLGSIATAEVLFLFFSIVWKLLFGGLEIWRVIVTIIIRAIFLVIVWCDDTFYVYVQEERKKV